MKVLYYTSGVTGSGRIVRGIAIQNALVRKKIPVDYTILSSSPFTELINRAGVNHADIEPEKEDILSPDVYPDSDIYKSLLELQPDILLVDLLWFPLHHFINDLKCKKIFLCRLVDYRFFSIQYGSNLLRFTPEAYDRILAIEPFTERLFPMEDISPIIIRNHEEILPRDQALLKLGLDDSEKYFLLSHNGVHGEFEEFKKKFRKMEKKGWRGVYSTNFNVGIFPTVDYYNAFDIIICGAGYNSFWETRFFNKNSIIVPTCRTFEDGKDRIREAKNYQFNGNGADQLVDIIMGM